MHSIRLAFAMASLLAMASAATPSESESSSSVWSIPTPTASVPLRAQKEIGCFNSSHPLEDHGYYLFQSDGNCQAICVLLKKPVMGLVDGTNCYCGDLIPAKNTQVDDKLCNTECEGIDTKLCGGPRKWWVALTGLTNNDIEYFEPPPESSAQAEVSSSVSTAVVTKGPTSAPQKQGGGPNKAGIAAGVVVGVVVLIAIIGGVVLFLRNKRRREVEEEYRRQAAANPFASGKLHTSNSSMTDSRLDPEFMARRQSNGSIADNEDYSRRILKVTNPDGH